MRYNKIMQTTPVHFPYRMSPLIIALCVAGALLSVASIVFSTWQFVGFVQTGDLASPYEWLKFVLWYGASLTLSAFILSMLVRSRYTLTDKTLTVQFGFIKQRFELEKIYSVHLFRGAKKLAVYFDDFHTDHIAVTVAEEQADEFVRALTERNPRIGFTFSTAEEEEEFKKKK